MKQLFQNLLGTFGYTIRRVSTLRGGDPASASRPVGVVELFLEDIRARGFKPRGIMDVGAHKGDWAQMAMQIFPEAHVIMIEPQTEMAPFLSEIQKSSLRCHLIQAGVGSKPGELVQTIWDDYAGSSFLPATDAKLAETGKQRKTKIVTLDSILAQDYPDFVPDLVKLDIQGFELEALAGAKTFFGRTEVFILEVSLFPFIEGWPIVREIVAFMAA
jgi:FkbM family methyltransferase